MNSRAEIVTLLNKYLVEMFEVPEEDIAGDAHLFEDLGLDSIDAVDLVVQLQEVTGKRIAPDEFKTVQTVDDVVDSVYRLLNE